MISNIKAWAALYEGKIMKSIKNLTMDDKGKAPHPSCQYVKAQDDQSK